MNTKISSIAICIAIVAGIFAASAANIGEYTLTVTSAQNTAVTSDDTTLPAALAGATSEQIGSFHLHNAGNVAADVNAQFTTHPASGGDAAVYGLFNDVNVIPGTSFYLKAATEGGAYIPLSAAATTDTLITIDGDEVLADSGADSFDVKVDVPANKVAAAYAGTVQLTFSNHI
jgi:hypothetical protein